jgi:crotonobetainyl-CoA:carnitine CoA-transferase CaiB-like acyl-CoA transferase
MSGQFMAVNRNKRSIALDLKHPHGKEVLERLIRTSDTIVSNIRPARLARLGFFYEECKAINPTLINTSASATG